MTPEHTKKLTIVLADNLPEDLNALVAFLEQSGFRVEVVRNGEAAIKDLGPSLQDLILVDTPTIRALQEQLQAQNIHVQKENERVKQEEAKRKHREETLKASEDRYRSVVEDQTELICRFSPDGDLTFVNQAYCRSVGKTPEALMGTPFFAFVPEEDQELVNMHLASLGQDRPVGTLEYRLIQPDGNLRWQQWTTHLIADERGHKREFQAVGRDITGYKEVEDKLAHYHEQVYDLVIERTRELTQSNAHLQQEISEHKQTIQALRTSEQQYRALAECMADGIGIFREGRLVFVNQALVSLFTYPPDQILPIDPIELLREDYQEEGRQRIISAHKKMSETSWQVPCITSDGREIWVEARQRGIEWQGKPAFLVTVRDITERKRQETAIKEERNHLRQENIALRATIQDRYKLDEIIGKSPVMQDVYQSIVDAATADTNVVLCGETGTGKDLVARTIHHLSKRKARAFVVVNCSAVPENLFEREFFGHRKGTFTGADQDQPGYFDRAHKGTLFLDEVGELTPTMQAKLLHVLENKAYTPLGETRSKKVDVRIIAATNKNLDEQLRKGLIREDFFYRIHVIVINLPPLRDHREDIPLLVDHFLKDYSEGEVDCSMMPGHIIEALCTYDWPGNVRELQNELQRYLNNQPLQFIGNIHATSETQDDVPRTGDDLANLALREALEAFEKRVIAAKLAQNHWRTKKTADMLGITQRCLQRKIKKYHLM